LDSVQAICDHVHRHIAWTVLDSGFHERPLGQCQAAAMPEGSPGCL
jgi:hypothetical protein